MKKKIIVLSLLFIMVISFSACGSEKKEDKKDQKKEETKREESKKEESLQITLPASLFDQEGMSDINTQMKQDGLDEVKVNEDGSVTYTMEKEAYYKLLEAVKGTIDTSISEMLQDKNSYPSYEEITYNDAITEFTVKVDAASYGGTQSFGALPLYAAGSKYQSVNQVAVDEIKTTVYFVDKETGETLETSDSVSAGASYQGN